MGLTNSAIADLKNIASLAYGSRCNEKSAGGNGFMGLMQCKDGTFRAFKCLTHREERNLIANAKDDAYTSGLEELKEASNQLRSALFGLAKNAGVGEETVRQIIADGQKDSPEVFKSLLSRKIVASVVAKIVENAENESGEAKAFSNVKAFWSDVKPLAGTEKHTMIGASGGNNLEDTFSANMRNVKALTVKDAEKFQFEDAMPTSLGDALNRIKSGQIGKVFAETIKRCLADASLLMPDFNVERGLEAMQDFSGPLPELNLLDDHQNEAFSKIMLFDKTGNTSPKRNVYRAFFEMSMERAVLEYKVDLYISRKYNGLAKDDVRSCLLAGGWEKENPQFEQLVAEEMLARKKAFRDAGKGGSAEFINSRLESILRTALFRTQVKALAAEHSLAMLKEPGNVLGIEDQAETEKLKGKLEDEIYGDVPDQELLRRISSHVDGKLSTEIRYDISGLARASSAMNSFGEDVDLRINTLSQIDHAINGDSSVDQKPGTFVVDEALMTDAARKELRNRLETAISDTFSNALIQHAREKGIVTTDKAVSLQNQAPVFEKPIG